MNWASLEQCVYESSKAAFKALQASNEGEHFYSYALYTDSSAMTITPSANSTEGLDKKIEQLDENEKTDDSIAYYKWAPSEWVYEACGGELFAAINSDLRSDVERVNFNYFRGQVINTMINALVLLVSEGFFGHSADDVTVFVTIADDDAAEEVENISAQSINTNTIYERFLNRYRA